MYSIAYSSTRTPELRRALLLVLLTFALLSAGRAGASFPPPYHAERAAIDAAARELSPSSDEAALERYLQEFVEDDKRPLVTREYAITRLGDRGIKTAEGYLLKLSEHGDDPVLRNAARRSYWEIHVEGLDPSTRRAELMNLLRGESEVSSSSVRLWAAQQFCEGGDAGLIDLIEQELAEFLGEKRRLEEMLLCRLQVAAISKGPTREAALAQALSTPDPTTMGRFHLWAIAELGDLGTKEAESALVNHALQLQNLDMGKNWQELSASVRALREMNIGKDELIRQGLSARLLAGVD